MRLFIITFAILSFPSILCAQQPADRETDPLVLKKLEWFQDQKFGFMMHWGIYSQWGCIESWPLVEADKWARPDDLLPWRERGHDFARFVRDYRALNTTFRPRRFDPDRWAAAAKAAGMKYVVFTTKHHDGFCMFDTRQTDYVIYLGDDGQSGPPAEITVHGIAAPRSVRMLGSDLAIAWTADAKRGLTIRVPEPLRKSPPCGHAWSFAVETK
jgi:hypothetical protein